MGGVCSVQCTPDSAQCAVLYTVQYDAVCSVALSDSAHHPIHPAPILGSSHFVASSDRTLGGGEVKYKAWWWAGEMKINKTFALVVTNKPKRIVLKWGAELFCNHGHTTLLTKPHMSTTLMQPKCSI